MRSFPLPQGVLLALGTALSLCNCISCDGRFHELAGSNLGAVWNEAKSATCFADRGSELLAYLCGAEPDPEDERGPHPKAATWIRLLRALVAEFVGTAILVFFCAASATAAAQFDLGFSSAAVVLVGAIQGFAVVALVSALAQTSGGHINPAVTLGLFVMRKLPIGRAVGYVIAQCCGGLVGAGLLAASLPRDQWNGLGSTTPAPFMSDWHAFFFEFMVTAAFVFVVLGTVGDQKSKVVKLAPIPIGFALCIGVWAANAFTGGSLNPARSLGPAVWTGTYDSHWVYWAGPLGGSLVSALLYRFVFTQDTPPKQKGDPQAPQENNQPPV